jgi:hypothetical protein
MKSSSVQENLKSRNACKSRVDEAIRFRFNASLLSNAQAVIVVPEPLLSSISIHAMGLKAPK